MKKIPSIIQVVAVSVLVFLADILLNSEANGSVLIGLIFWAGVGQGIIAISAAAELSKGKWITNLRPYLHEYFPLLVISPIVFLIFARHMVVYTWSGNPSEWLNASFFIIRNVVALLLPVIFGNAYVNASKKESPKVGLFAVLYLVSVVIGQSFIAYDQVMTFEYPWTNTLFGPFFFVESLYAGIAFSAILSGVLALKDPARFKSAFNDFTIMIMGFALLWAGLFYSQYLVIWYGNLPEEVEFIEKRLSIPAINSMGIFIISALFLIPFLALVSRKVKASAPWVVSIAILVFSGLIVERLIYLIPVANLSVFGVTIPFILLGLPYIYLILNLIRVNSLHSLTNHKPETL